MALRSNPCQGSSSLNWYDLYKKMGHWSPETESSPVRSFSLILWKIIGASAISEEASKGAAYSRSDQSTPTGQRSAPVTSWLNPLSVLILRAIGGRRGSLGGQSQSTIADFRLFVSSDLAPEAPFCNCTCIGSDAISCKVDAIIGLAFLTHQRCARMYHLCVACHQTFFQPRNHP